MTSITRILVTSLIFITPLILNAQSSPSAERALVWEAGDEELQWVPCPEFMPESCRISILHGNPANPNTDLFFKLEGNTSVPEHTHTSAERMVLVSGELQVDYEGQQADVMTAGDYGYGPSELPHSASCVSDEPCVLFIAFEEPVDAFPTDL